MKRPLVILDWFFALTLIFVSPVPGRSAWAKTGETGSIMGTSFINTNTGVENPGHRHFNPSAPSPPQQPVSGPGGSDYQHGSVTVSSYESGENRYWIYEPASPTPLSAPVIVFNHGWLGIDPEAYGAWIRHIARKGNIVIYPVYQSLLTLPGECSGNAVSAVKNALDDLRAGEHVRPEVDKLAVIGHSMGGFIAANMAAGADTYGLPQPKAVMLVEPGEVGLLPPFDPTGISSETLLLAVTGSEDNIAGNYLAQKIFNETSQISPENKNLVTVYSDWRGSPALVADHFSPLSYLFADETDALDYYCFWKLGDGLTDAAFYGKNREYCLGNTPEQRFMGFWSDRVPVRELEITEIPPAVTSPVPLSVLSITN